MNKHLHISVANGLVIGSADLWLLECGDEGWND